MNRRSPRRASRHPLATLVHLAERSRPTRPATQDGRTTPGTPSQAATTTHHHGNGRAATDRTGETDQPAASPGEHRAVWAASRGPLGGPPNPGRAAPSVEPPICGEAGGLLEQMARTAGLLGLTSAVGWLLTTDLVSGPLTIPMTSLDELRRWLDDCTPAILPAALLRLAALGACAYLALALGLTLLAQIVDRRTGGRAVRAVRRLLPATLQQLLTGSAQCSLVAVTAFPLAALPLGAIGGTGDGPPGPTATMVKLDEGPATTAPAASAAPIATATMTRLPAPPPPTTHGSPTTTVTTIAPTTAPTSLAPVPPPPRAPAPAIPPENGESRHDRPTADEIWTVTPGDTFWSIAEEALADRGSFPTQPEIVRYWRQLIATNQSRLAAPANPDLLLPGQSLVLPPPS
jgi:hypothetical protein